MFKARLTTNDQILLAKRLSFLIGAGISLEKAFDIVTKQSRHRIQPILISIASYIHEGQTLTHAFSHFPTSFPSYVIKLIRAGEESGLLQESLHQVAADLTQRKAITQKVVSACIYPFVIVLGTIALSLFLLLIIFPKIRTLFHSLNMKLPLSTRLIIFLSDTFQKFGIEISLVLIIATLASIYSLKKSKRLQYTKDILLLSIPLFNTLFKNYMLASFYRTLGVMLNAHITINKALSYASESINNKVYRAALVTIAHESAQGKSISESVRRYPKLFKDAEVQLLEVGETSGSLAQTLIYLSEMLDQEIESSLKILTSLIEPLLMVTMGLVVGFIAISIISPIYAITQNIKH